MAQKCDDGLMTTEEVAAMLRVTPETVRWRRHMGRGPVGFAEGRRVLYRRADVEAYLEAARTSDPHTKAAG